SSVKAKKMDGTEIPVAIHLDMQSLAETTHIGGYDLKVTPKKAEDFINQAANALNLYREILGIDYPFAKLDLVNDPLGGFYGQAPSSLIYLGNPDFWNKGIMSGGLEAGARLSTFQDSVVAHEVAHQWWGSLVCNVNDNNYWFVESLAEYMSALYTENYYGKKQYAEHVEAWRKEILDADMRGSVQDGYTVWQGPGGFRPYRAALYAKGPYAFHIMRSTWGDEAFFKFLKSLANELKGKEIVTRDIQKVAEKSFGANLDWFFDQWLRGVGLPEFTFNYTTRTAEDGSEIVEGDVVQRIMLKPASAVKEVLPGLFFKGIVPITVIGKSGKEYRKRVIIEGEKTSFKFNVPEKPKEIIFNKNGESLAYDIKVNGAT
ncbi:MAG TPA: M1 family aminopeptidase, partial [Candidatus Polarisedimenticolia bacterium]|nr:M1 family aminopeptidase [Candidatus Polarisedimenticolia bacterium]